MFNWCEPSTEAAYDGPNQTGNAQVTTYVHDKQGRRLSVTLPDNSAWQYMLDDAGLVKQRTDARGIVTVYDRNWRGQVLTATVDSVQEEYYEYDELGRSRLAKRDERNHVSFVYDDLGNLIGETQMIWDFTKTFLYPEYTQSGKRRTVGYPADTGVTLIYEYDKLDNVTAIKRNGATLIDYPQYASNKWLQRVVTLDDSPLTTLTSTANRLGLNRRVYGIAHTAQHDSQTVYAESLNYANRDLVGNPNNVVRSGHSPTAGTSSYLYDTLHRVTDADYSADSTTEDINLDVLGNRTTYTGRDETQVTYTHNLVNQYTALNPQTTAPEYDANGNLTRNDRGFRFEYDYENRLKLIKAPNGLDLAEYWYDALGRRNCEYRTDAVALGAATVFYYDGRNVAVEYDYIYYDLLRYYVHGTTYIDERAVVHDVADNKDYAFALNDVYSVVALVDDQAAAVGAYTYDVYGLMHPSDPTDRDPRYAFQGRSLATYTTLQGATLPIYDFRARTYDPILGRFMQHDPAEYIDSYNLYLAMGGNPLVWMDPTGRFTLGGLTGAVGTGAQLYGYYNTTTSIVGWIQQLADGASLRSVLLDATLHYASNYVGGKLLDKLVGVVAPMMRATAANATKSLRPDKELHHLLPKEFAENFKGKFDVERFIISLDKGTHRLKPGGIHTGSDSWNKQWKQFFDEYPDASPDQILEQLIEMRYIFGI